MRANPLEALVTIEAAATALAFAADVCLVLFDRTEAARNIGLYPLAIAVSMLCITAIFAIPHAPNRGYIATTVALVTLLGLGWLPPPGLLLFVLDAILAARLIFAFGFSGAACAWLVGCAALTIRVAAVMGGTPPGNGEPIGLAAYALQIVPYAILLALIFGMIGLMKVYAASSADAAASTERTRIALDLHDFLGHGLTALRVQLQNAERYRDTDPQKADSYIARAMASSGELLDDVRATVGLLHDEASAVSPSFSVLFERLCTDFAATHSAALHREMHASAEPSGRVAVALYRTIQEALTNVARHAYATNVWVTIRDDGRSMEACIEDDGCGIAPDARSRGHGLLSMRQRIAGVGGEFSVDGRTGGGTAVRASVPLEATR